MALHSHQLHPGDRVKMRDGYMDNNNQPIICWIQGTIISTVNVKPPVASSSMMLKPSRWITTYDIIFDDGTRRSISHGSVFPIEDNCDRAF